MVFNLFLFLQKVNKLKERKQGSEFKYKIQKYSKIILLKSVK